LPDITTNRLHALTINLLEQLNGLDDFIFDPASFDIGSFPYVQRESERCCDQAIMALGNLHQELLKTGLQKYWLKQDDRALLPSAQLEVGTRNWKLSAPAPLNLVAPTDNAAIKEDSTRLIKKEEVSKPLSAIDEFLAKRMRSRESFRDELNRPSMISTTISPISSHQSFIVSPVLQPTPMLTDSSSVNSRISSTLLTTLVETLDGQGPRIPLNDDLWSSSSPMEGEDSMKMLTNEQDELGKYFVRQGRGMPSVWLDTPPNSLGSQSTTNEWGALGIPLAGILKVPGFGAGVEDGLEVVDQKLIPDPRLIPVDEKHDDLRELTPPTSVQSVDHAMRHDSSFFKYGGFCDGAKMSWRGAGGTMKELAKYGVRNSLLSLYCLEC
jgi:hypothetical protein